MPHILIIEDDDVMRDMLIQMMKMDGYKVTGAENGNRAIEHLKENSFDLVITDLVMLLGIVDTPVISGE